MAEGPFIPISQQHSSNSKALWDFGSYGKSNRKSLLYETEVLAIQDKLPWYAEKCRDIQEILPCVWCIFMGNSTHSLLLVIIALNIISYHSPNYYISSLGVHYWDHILLDSGIGFRWET